MVVPRMSAGIRSGRGLHALEAEAEQPAQRLDDQRFGDARHAFKQRMALAENGDQHLFDRLVLAGDHAAHLRAGVGDQLAGCAQRALAVLACVLSLVPGLCFLAHEALSCCLE